MNVFVLDADPYKAGQMVCLKHRVKMPIEGVGMMLYAFPENSTPLTNSRSHRHYKHPASIFTRYNKAAFEWVLINTISISDAYERSYKRKHASANVIEWIKDNYNQKACFDFDEMSNFPNFARCFGKHKDILDKTVLDTVEAYRKFYWLDKKDFALWPSYNEIPSFWPRDYRFVSKHFINGVYQLRK